MALFAALAFDFQVVGVFFVAQGRVVGVLLLNLRCRLGLGCRGRSIVVGFHFNLNFEL